MKLINPSVELITQEAGLEGIYKIIEKVGRTCYKSEDKITESSTKPFVDKLIKSRHLSMLEHATVHLKFPASKDVSNYQGYQYNRVYQDIVNFEYVIITNYRFIIEHHLEEDMKFLWQPSSTNEDRITLKLTTSIGVSREFNRHRVNSIAEQSTRYCNYSKEKFGSEVSFVIPSWLDLKEGSYDWKKYFNDRYIDESSPLEDQFIANLISSEYNYLNLIKQGWKPQQAREVLPLSTATEVVYTAYVEDWRHFFKLRSLGTTGQPHPNAKQVAEMAHDLILEKLGLDLYEDEKVTMVNM